MNASDIAITHGPVSLVLKAATTYTRGQRVTLDGDGLLAVAGDSELGVGVIDVDAVAGTGTSGVKAAVHLFNMGGVLPVTAAGAIDAGDKVQLAASGKVAVHDGGTAVGIALSTTGAVDETVRVLFY